MSVQLQGPGPSTPLPVPAHFDQASQSFSLKKRRLPFSSSSSSIQSSLSVPPRPSCKACPHLSRVFTPRSSPWTPLSRTLSESRPPQALYDPGKQQTFFSQCFTNLGLLGLGSYGEVYKALSHQDGRQYAVKRSVRRFRGSGERRWSVREARNHERLCPHPYILGLVAAWEEAERLYIQTELCCTSLLLHAESQAGALDEAEAWSYLCDLLAALQHVHAQGFVHLDVKPANVFLTHSGRLKLGDFGLLMELQAQGGPEGRGEEEELQEGDPRYMAPELLRGEYGPAADVFSLGVSILELACNMEVPKGGEGWQQLRKGHLPSEFTSCLSVELQVVLKMMLAPEPGDRPSVPQLLSLPSVRRRRWRRSLLLFLTEAALNLLSLYQWAVSIGWRLVSLVGVASVLGWKAPAPRTPPRESWEKDSTLPLSALLSGPGSPEEDGVFVQEPLELPAEESPPHRMWSRLSAGNSSTPLPSRLPPTTPPPGSTHHPSCIRSPGTSCRTPPRSVCSQRGTPVASGRLSTCARPSRPGQDGSWLSVEPKNLLSLFEETAAPQPPQP